MPSQRPFFLSTFFAAFRQQPTTTSTLTSAGPQSNKHTGPTATGSSSSYSTSAATAPRSIASAATAQAAAAAAAAAAASSSSPSPSRAAGGGGGSVIGQLPLHSPRTQHQPHAAGGIPIPQSGGRRRGSDSSSEGFREVLGADKMYIGGRTAAGEEKFFKLGVVRRVRSGDRLSLDRLSL